MACPKCNSANVRKTEDGIAQDSYYCNDCKHSYERFTPAAKKWALLLAGGVILGPGVLIILGGGDGA